MIERRIFGRNDRGRLKGESMGVVEVIPDGGVYDFKRKYSVGATEYRYPAVLPLDLENGLKRNGDRFQHCGCRVYSG